MADRTIHSAVNLGPGYTFGPGAEKELDEVLSDAQVKRLKDLGAISGKWSGKGTGRIPKAPPAPATKLHEVESTNALPAGFPGRQLLIKAGYATITEVRTLPEDELTKLLKKDIAAKVIEALES